MGEVDITLMVDMQEKLDRTINEKRKSERTFIPEKILALHVEIAELAQEWGLFKYWKERPYTKSRERVLEEYADGLHFILSLTVERLEDFPHLRHLKINYPEGEEVYDVRVITQLFNDIFENVAYLYEDYHFNYKPLYELYFRLGHALGFTFEEVSNAYLKKNEINYERLKYGY